MEGRASTISLLLRPSIAGIFGKQLLLCSTGVLISSWGIIPYTIEYYQMENGVFLLQAGRIISQRLLVKEFLLKGKDEYS